MNYEEKQLYEYLLSNCQGAAHAETMERIAYTLDLCWREVAELKHNLVVQYGLPIAASRRKPLGIFIIETAQERKAYLKELEAALRETHILRRSVMKASEPVLARQGELF